MAVGTFTLTNDGKLNWLKGDIDPDNNFKVKTDCYNMSINNLAIYSKHEKYL